MARPLKIRTAKAIRDLLFIQYEHEKLVNYLDDIGLDVTRVYDILRYSPLHVALDLLGIWQDNTEMFDLAGPEGSLEWPEGCFSRDHFFEEFSAKITDEPDPDVSVDEAIDAFIRDCRDVVRRYIEEQDDA